MTDNRFKAGQKVRAEWHNGSGAIEGMLVEDSTYAGGLVLRMHPWRSGGSQHICPMSIAGLLELGTVTVLAEPRPEEPTGLGAVVRARFGDSFDEGLRERMGRTVWVRRVGQKKSQPAWVTHDGNYYSEWDRLTDIEILQQGWSE